MKLKKFLIPIMISAFITVFALYGNVLGDTVPSPSEEPVAVETTAVVTPIVAPVVEVVEEPIVEAVVDSSVIPEAMPLLRIDENLVMVRGFDRAVAKGQKDLIVTEDARTAIQILVDRWLADDNLVLCLTGIADGYEFGDWKNPAIALSRCGISFKIVQEMGAGDLARIRFFVKEVDEKGPQYRGFNVSLESSAWAAAADFAALEVTVGEIIDAMAVINKMTLVNGFDVTNNTARIDDLCLRFDEFEFNKYIVKIGVGVTGIKDFPIMPSLHGVIGKDKIYVELDIAHSVFAKSVVMQQPYRTRDQTAIYGEFKTFARYASARVSYLLLEDFVCLFDTDLDLYAKLGWHWCEQNTYDYSGYYKWFDGPEVGLGVLFPFDTDFDITGNVYYIPARETTYPDPNRNWDNSRFRFSINILKTL